MSHRLLWYEVHSERFYVSKNLYFSGAKHSTTSLDAPRTRTIAALPQVAHLGERAPLLVSVLKTFDSNPLLNLHSALKGSPMGEPLVVL